MTAATQPAPHVRGLATAAVGTQKESGPTTSATAAATPRQVPVCWFYQCHRPGDTQRVKEESRRRAENYFAQLKAKPGVYLVRGETIEDDSRLQSRFLQRPMGQKLHDMLQPGDHVIFAALEGSQPTKPINDSPVPRAANLEENDSFGSRLPRACQG